MASKLKPFFAFILAISNGIASPAIATDHGLTVISSSPSALADLNQHLPKEVSTRLMGTVSQFAGPLTTSMSLDSPAGVWLRWRDGLPSPVLLLQHFDNSVFKQAIETNGLSVKNHGDGISELELASPVFYRESGDWFYIATALEDLREVADPLAEFGGEVQHTVVARIYVDRIPVSARTEIAKVVKLRLLPPAISQPSEISADGLIHLYASRVLNDITNLSETVTLSIDADAHGLAISVDVEGQKLTRLVQKSARIPLPGFNEFSNGLRLHTSLKDEEIAFLSWWAQSLPEQVSGAFEQATIEQRGGQTAIAEATRVLANLVDKTANSGELEAFATLVGQEQETPLVGVRVQSGDWVDDQLHQWVNAGHASELQVSGVEFDFEAVQGVKLHRFTIAESETTTVSVIVGIGADRMFVTSGQEGLAALREFLTQQPNSAEVPSPLQLKVDNVNLASILGWKGQEEGRGRLELDSDYTEHGVHYQAKFLAD